ncbi:hypothetical protein NOR_04037 [Metarhizium rileyi]|uniref:Uncharacterized protein n=1 Tax=Metarhizium rileyi (strain RCEF 4871) TaxID=1649241 RepID=A0A167ERJ9_METRR|nr:hypothetical protein NOR_04037 [Metarhizium rileyi RCEF 4871]
MARCFTAEIRVVRLRHVARQTGSPRGRQSIKARWAAEYGVAGDVAIVCKNLVQNGMR